MSDVRLYLGDCLDVMKTLPDNSVDAVVTDPPYNSALAYATYEDKLPDNNYWAWLIAVREQCMRVSRNIVVIKHSALKICDWVMHMGKMRMLVWYKPFSSGFPMNGFATHYEPLWICKGKAVKWSKDVIEVSAGACNRESSYRHPAQMPEQLARHLIEICAEPNATVLDCFLGSGTTGAACVRAGRNFIGIEISPEYFAIAKRRIEEAQLQLRMPLETR